MVLKKQSFDSMNEIELEFRNEMLTNEYDDAQPIFNQSTATHLAPESTFIGWYFQLDYCKLIFWVKTWIV